MQARVLYNFLALLSLLALVGEAYVGFALWFAPGWANGWPFGLRRQVVWPCGLAVMLFLLLMTLAVAAGAVVGLSLQGEGAGRQVHRRVAIGWLVLSAVVALAICTWAGHEFYQ